MAFSAISFGIILSVGVNFFDYCARVTALGFFYANPNSVGKPPISVGNTEVVLFGVISTFTSL